MSEETDTINELISSITTPTQSQTETSTNDSPDRKQSFKPESQSDKAAKPGLFLIPNDSQLHAYIMKRLPLMMIYSGKLDDETYDNADIDWETSNRIDLMNNWGIMYEKEGSNIYVRTLQGFVTKVQKNASTVKNGLLDSFRKHYGLSGNSDKNKQKALENLAKLMKSYNLPVEIAKNKNGIINVWTVPTSSELSTLTKNLQLVNPESDEINVQQVKVKPSRGRGSKKQPKEETEQPKEETEQPEAEPEQSDEVNPKEEKLVEANKPPINPQILNDLVDNQNQQLATTDAIKTEILNTKNQLEEQKKILEKQNEILSAKDEFEKKLLSNKKILRYIEAEDTFSFNELVNTVDDLLSSPGKEADEFLIASAVQSVLTKRDALEKVRNIEKRKKSSQWSKAKIKDIRVEVKRDDNISPLLARTIASIS